MTSTPITAPRMAPMGTLWLAETAAGKGVLVDVFIGVVANVIVFDSPVLRQLDYSDYRE